MVQERYEYSAPCLHPTANQHHPHKLQQQGIRTNLQFIPNTEHIYMYVYARSVYVLCILRELAPSTEYICFYTDNCRYMVYIQGIK